MHRATVGSYGGAFSYERGTPVVLRLDSASYPAAPPMICQDASQQGQLDTSTLLIAKRTQCVGPLDTAVILQNKF
jgi:hypothetical protein